MFALQQSLEPPGGRPPIQLNKAVVQKLRAKTYDEIRARVMEERHKTKK